MNKNGKKNKALLIYTVILVTIIVVLSGVAIYFLTNNKNQDNTIIESINALKETYQKADEALLEGIKQVQKNLDDLQTRLDEKDKDLENKLNSYIIENDKTMFVYLLINITFAVIIIILSTTLVIKAIRKKKSQN